MGQDFRLDFSKAEAVATQHLDFGTVEKKGGVEDELCLLHMLKPFFFKWKSKDAKGNYTLGSDAELLWASAGLLLAVQILARRCGSRSDAQPGL